MLSAGSITTARESLIYLPKLDLFATGFEHLSLATASARQNSTGYAGGGDGTIATGSECALGMSLP